VGYTHLMEKDETGTHAQLHEIRDRMTDPDIAGYGGRASGRKPPFGARRARSLILIKLASQRPP
jgi:hypothetical protein